MDIIDRYRELDRQRLYAYAFFTGAVKGLREMAAKQWITSAELIAKLSDAQAELDAKLADLKVQP